MREPTHGEKITCALDRTPEAIARDIIARLLQRAREHLAKSKSYDQKRRKEEATQKLKENYLKKYLTHQWHNGGNPAWTNEYQEPKPAAPISAYIRYDGTIEIKTNLPIKQALKLIKKLQESKI